ncbi:hypothetical protein V8C86DRAFT_3108185 [Haematococcus lacustris]
MRLTMGRHAYPGYERLRPGPHLAAAEAQALLLALRLLELRRAWRGANNSSRAQPSQRASDAGVNRCPVLNVSDVANALIEHHRCGDWVAALDLCIPRRKRNTQAAATGCGKEEVFE